MNKVLRILGLHYKLFDKYTLSKFKHRQETADNVIVLKRILFKHDVVWRIPLDAKFHGKTKHRDIKWPV